MKVNNRIRIVVAMILLAGCKAGRKVTERMVGETDSRAVWVLQDSLQRQERQMVTLRSDGMRHSEENVNLRSDGVLYEIEYDTTAPLDSATGRHPVLSERFSVTTSSQEKNSVTMQREQREEVLQRDILLREFSSLQLKVDHLSRENRVLKEQYESPTPFNFKLLLVGIVFGAIIPGGFMLRRKS